MDVALLVPGLELQVLYPRNTSNSVLDGYN